uniref:Uncharacterized protein n=1 Tax=Strigamia maritima TaxID=126957 RepID=T1JP53_STRMM
MAALSIYFTLLAESYGKRLASTKFSYPLCMCQEKKTPSLIFFLETLFQHCSVFNKLTEEFGTPSIDLFASRLNFKLKIFYSWAPDPEA